MKEKIDNFQEAVNRELEAIKEGLGDPESFFLGLTRLSKKLVTILKDEGLAAELDAAIENGSEKIKLKSRVLYSFKNNPLIKELEEQVKTEKERLKVAYQSGARDLGVEENRVTYYEVAKRK